MRVTMLLRVCLLVLFVPAAASADSISGILSNTVQYDGHVVRVAGRVEHLHEKISHAGNSYATFLVCSDACIKVFTFGDPGIVDAQRVTVEGQFELIKRVGRYVFTDEIQTTEQNIK